MRKISCIAIDDEPIALLVIKRFCERKGNMELTSFCEPRIGLEEIVRTKPDLVFLDIEMNGLSGLDVAKALPEKCTLVFTTAHAKYALDGFNLDAVDSCISPSLTNVLKGLWKKRCYTSRQMRTKQLMMSYKIRSW